jgi:uncharacterized protein (UPF0128 family)
MTDASAFYLDEAAVEEVVRRFESCELPPAEFDHRAHLTVALCYLLRATDEEARGRIRAGIARYVRAHGINPKLYHETLTVFWLKRVRAFVERTGAGARTRVEMANGLAAECGGSRLVFDYYSKELIDSERARQEWTEPDLRPLDF